MVKRMMTGTKFNIDKFDEKNDFGLWQVRMKALLEQQGLAAALEKLPASMIVAVKLVRGQSHKEEATHSGVIYVSGSQGNGYDSVDVMMAMSVEELLD
ncbi:hypothetical protein Tco_1190133 [Tanacetum coccineum]